MGKVPLSKWLMNRRMRTRMYGGVGRAGEKPALTRLCSLLFNQNYIVSAGADQMLDLKALSRGVLVIWFV